MRFAFDHPLFYLPTAFILGAMTGSLLNVCIVRMPAGRSLWWPGSICGACLRLVRWYDNIPLLSYWILGGRCRHCGARFSIRYFWIELITACAFAGLWWLELHLDVRGVAIRPDGAAFFNPSYRLVPIWLFHAIFVWFCLCIGLTARAGRPLPRSLVRMGVLAGCGGAILLPWPWPLTVPQLHAGGWLGSGQPRVWQRVECKWLETPGLQPWPLWSVLPDWLPPGSPALGAATALCGILMGRLVGRLADGLEHRIGLSRTTSINADILMIMGAFLGWQTALLAGVLGWGMFVGVRAPVGPRLAGAWWIVEAVGLSLLVFASRLGACFR